MEDMARLALVEQNVRDTEKFNKLLHELLRQISNILENPHDYELRTIKSDVIKSYFDIESVVGYLMYIGFEKIDNEYSYPKEQTLNKLRMAQAGIERKVGFCCGSIGCRRSNVWPQRCMGLTSKPKFTPTEVLKTKNPLLLKLESLFNGMLKYEDEELQQLARERVPLVSLQLSALDRVRDHQRRIKAGEIQSEDLPFDIALLMELLSWYKHEFFRWVDKPECESCSGATKYVATDSMRTPTETCTVELYQCTQCPTGRAEFPRYNDLRTLLRTRRGRCGEWANVFTLLCRTLGYDTRYVYDTTDHVWCEVYDHESKMWLHVDPCENKLDAPLMYSQGWGKKLSYVFAFSCDDLQDVTWRYTTNHKEVLQRRREVGEAELVSAILTLRGERQRQVSDARRRYLAKRTLEELAQLMVERSTRAAELEGRASGARAWRRARGEAGGEAGARAPAHEFRYARAGRAALQYCCAADAYTLGAPDATPDRQTTIKTWAAGAYSAKDVFRKVEDDWKMVYLAREEGVDLGWVTWRFATEPGLVFTSVSVRTWQAVYRCGRVRWTLRFDDLEDLPADLGKMPTRYERRFKTLELRAELSGGAGSAAWQHAQLFRQPLHDCAPMLHLLFNVDCDP